MSGTGLLHLSDTWLTPWRRACFSLCYFVIGVVAVLTMESMATVGGILSVRKTPGRLRGSESVSRASMHTVVSRKRVNSLGVMHLREYYD